MEANTPPFEASFLLTCASGVQSPATSCCLTTAVRPSAAAPAATATIQTDHPQTTSKGGASPPMSSHKFHGPSQVQHADSKVAQASIGAAWPCKGNEPCQPRPCGVIDTEGAVPTPHSVGLGS